MYINQIFAHISHNEVKNIIVCDNYEMADWLGKSTYGEEAFAVESTDYHITIGDKFRNGNFYRIENKEEVLIEKNNTQEDKILKLQSQIEYLSMMSGFKMEENNEK